MEKSSASITECPTHSLTLGLRGEHKETPLEAQKAKRQIKKRRKVQVIEDQRMGQRRNHYIVIALTFITLIGFRY